MPSSLGHGYSLTNTASNSLISSGNGGNLLTGKSFFTQPGKNPYSFQNFGW